MYKTVLERIKGKTLTELVSEHDDLDHIIRENDVLVVDTDDRIIDYVPASYFPNNVDMVLRLEQNMFYAVGYVGSERLLRIITLWRVSSSDGVSAWVDRVTNVGQYIKE